MIKKTKPKGNKFWVRFTLVTMAGFVLTLGASLYLHFIKLDVIEDTSRNVSIVECSKDPECSFKVGDAITLNASSRKLRNVRGTSSRYIVCEYPNNSEGKFPIGEASANRKPGDNSNNIYLKIPNNIPLLPATCAIQVETDYGWAYKFEQFRSPKFRLNPNEDATKEPDPVSLSPDVDNLVVENAPKTPVVNGTDIARQVPSPIVDLPGPQFPVPEAEPPTSPDTRNILQKTIDGIVDGAVNTLQFIKGLF